MRDSAVGMCLITPEGRITDPNQALCTFLGRPAEELATVTWQELTKTLGQATGLTRGSPHPSGCSQQSAAIRPDRPG